MTSTNPTRVREELLEALFKARRRVEQLEAALAQNAVLLGTGVEMPKQRDVPPPSGGGPQDLLSYLQLVEDKADISDYLGIEGDEATRPRLGPDAPDYVRPDKKPRIDPLVGQLAVSHPADSIIIPSSGGPVVPPPSPQSQPSKKSPPKTDAAKRAPGSPQAAGAPPAANAAAMEAARDELLRCRLAVEISGDGILDWDLVSGTVHLSPRWQEMMPCAGLIREQPPGPLLGVVHPSDREAVDAQLSTLLKGGQGVMSMEARICGENGTWRWGALRAACLKRDGAPVRVMAVMSDITALREAGQAPKGGEDQFRVFAEESPDFIGRFDAQSRLLYTGASIGRYLPLTPEEAVGRTFSALGFGGDATFFEENLHQTFEMGLSVQAEIQLTSPLLGEFTADCRFWPEFGPQGEVRAVTAQLRDMTISKRVAKSYQALFNSMADGFALFEHTTGWGRAKPTFEADEFTLIAMNPALARMLKKDQTGAVGLSLSELLGPDAPLWAECLARVLIEGKPLQSSLRAFGGDVHFHISAYSPEKGKAACIVKDVSHLYAFEQEVRLNEARIAALYHLSHMDAAPEDEVVQYSLDHAVHLTGSGFGYLYMLQRGEGGPWNRYRSREFPEEGLDVQPEAPMSEKGHNLDPEARRLRRAKVVNGSSEEGTLFFGAGAEVRRYMLAPVVEDGRVVCMAGVANKERPYEESDLRQLELFINGMWFQLRRRWSIQALQQAKDAAEAASHAKNEFLANVSHELRTPLNGILGMLQLLQQSPLSREQAEHVVTASHSGLSLLRVISDILDFSRIEAGKFVLERQVFDFAATVRSTLGMFAHQATRKNIKLSVFLDEGIPALLTGDDARVRQIIINLVGNAVKFTKQGEVSVECWHLPMRPGGRDCIYLRVTDTGIGIPDNRLDDIFNAFTQLDGSMTRRFSGTGLGLGIVRRLVEYMGGSLCMESELEQGSAVHCSLCFDAAPAELALAHGEPAQEALPCEPLDILVAEDDPVSRLTIRRFLGKHGHRVECVDNGRQALAVLMRRHFDCLITDIQMPEMDGVELVRRIRENDMGDIDLTADAPEIADLGPATSPREVPREIPIMALTAHAMSGDKERFLSLGMDYYLAKPIIAADLNAVVCRVSAILHARNE